MMTIAELVKKYKIYEPKTKKGMLSVDKSISKAPEDISFVKEHKQEILDYLHEEEARREETFKKYAEENKAWKASIGLDKLEEAIRKFDDQKEAFDRAFERGDGRYPAYPDSNKVEEIRAMHPVANAYLTAESWSCSAHRAKSSAGRKAKERIRNGEDYVKVLEEMEAEFMAYCEEHIWD